MLMMVILFFWFGVVNPGLAGYLLQQEIWYTFAGVNALFLGIIALIA
jgi:hypothetical protein